MENTYSYVGIIMEIIGKFAWKNLEEKFLLFFPIQNCNGVAGGGKIFMELGNFGGKFHDLNPK